MGQPITVVESPSASNPAVLRFETNRPLSGMGHERYAEPPSDLLVRPVDELARRLFAAGGVESVHINGSVVTVILGGGRTGAGLGDIVRGLFLHYGEQPGSSGRHAADGRGGPRPGGHRRPGGRPRRAGGAKARRPPTPDRRRSRPTDDGRRMDLIRRLSRAPGAAARPHAVGGRPPAGRARGGR